MIGRRALLGGLGLLIPATAHGSTIITSGAMSARALGFGRRASAAGVVWDGAKKAADIVLSSTNHTAAVTNPTAGSVLTLSGHSSGKFYAEIHVDTSGAGGTVLRIGLTASTFAYGSANIGSTADSIGYRTNGTVSVNNAAVTTIAAYATGNVICLAVDLTNKTLWYRVNNGSWNNNGSADPATNTGGLSISGVIGGGVTAYLAVGSNTNAADSWGVTLQAANSFTPPSGFSSW